MDLKNDKVYGNITVSEDKLIACVVNTALDVDGVCELDTGLTGNIAKNLLGRDMSTSKGIRFSNKNDEMVIDVYIIAKYGVKIPQLAWELQTRIREEVKAVTGADVSEVNIHVQGVSLRGEE